MSRYIKNKATKTYYDRIQTNIYSQYFDNLLSWPLSRKSFTSLCLLKACTFKLGIVNLHSQQKFSFVVDCLLNANSIFLFWIENIWIKVLRQRGMTTNRNWQTTLDVMSKIFTMESIKQNKALYGLLGDYLSLIHS